MLSERLGQFRICLMFLLAPICVSATACSSDKLAVHPVRGRVLIDGKPAAGAMVVFHPLGASNELGKLRPVGRVGPDGSFSLATYDREDGAPAGEYKVTIRQLEENDFAESAAQAGSSIERAVTAVAKVPPQYSSPHTSDLQITIRAGKNELAPFNLEWAGGKPQERPSS